MKFSSFVIMFPQRVLFLPLLEQEGVFRTAYRTSCPVLYSLKYFYMRTVYLCPISPQLKQPLGDADLDLEMLEALPDEEFYSCEHFLHTSSNPIPFLLVVV